MEFLEFMELIARVAHYYFLGVDSDQKPLSEKIAYVLDEFLAVVNMQREEAQPYEEVRLQSEDGDPDAVAADTVGCVELPGLYD